MDNSLDIAVINLSHFSLDKTYCGGILVAPSFASHVCKTSMIATIADALHVHGVVTQSYGILFRVLTYDANKHHVILFFFALS